MGYEGGALAFKIMSSRDIHRRLLREQFPEIDLPEDEAPVFIEDYQEQLSHYPFFNQQKFNQLSEKLLSKGQIMIEFGYILRYLKVPLLLAPNIEDFSSPDLIIFNITNRQFYILHKGKVKMLNLGDSSFRLKAQLVDIAKQTDITLINNSLNALFNSCKCVNYPSGYNNEALKTHGVETRGVETRGVETHGVETRVGDILEVHNL